MVVFDITVYPQENQLRRIGQIECGCNCPVHGYQLNYECTTIGAGATKVVVNSTGSRCNIDLLHSQILNHGTTMKMCSNNEIGLMGQSVLSLDSCQSGDQVPENSCYFLTIINVTINSLLIDFTVNCSSTNSNNVVTVAGIDTISSITGICGSKLRLVANYRLFSN